MLLWLLITINTSTLNNCDQQTKTPPMFSTYPSNSTTIIEAVQYDLSMAIYALQKAMSRLPPEVETPLNLNIMDSNVDGPMYATTLHQDLRAAIFSAELILDRITIEGIQDGQAQPAAHEAALSTVAAWNHAMVAGCFTHTNDTGKQELYAQQTAQSSTGTTAQHPKALALTPQMAQPTHSSKPAVTDPSQPFASSISSMRSNSVLETGGSNTFYFAFPPCPEEYASLHKADQYVAHRLWEQLAPFIVTGAQQALWERATRKLAELRIQGNQKGTWSEHVVKETASWRCLKVWQAVREELLRTSAYATREDQERLEAVTNVLVSIGEKI
jgi:hypothetical protein